MNPIRYIINTFRRKYRFWKSADYDNENHRRNVIMTNALIGGSRYEDAFFMFTEKFREKLLPDDIVWQKTRDYLEEKDKLFLELFSEGAKFLIQSGKSIADDYLSYYYDYKPALGVLRDYANGKALDDDTVSDAGNVLVSGVVKFLSNVLEKANHSKLHTSPAIDRYINTDFKQRKADYEERKANAKLF